VDGVAAHLRELISKGALQPGMRLNELRLAHDLSLSRSPIREAFRMLAVEGLVAITPRRGARVRPISLDELQDVFEMRSLFELFALGRSDRRNPNEHAHMRALLRQADAFLERGDVEAWYESSQAFHDAIIDSAGNRQLKALYELIKMSMRRYQLMVIGLPRHPDRSQAEHQEIFDAFAAGNRGRASDLLRAHLKRVTDTLAVALKSGRTEAELRRRIHRRAASARGSARGRRRSR
jgi:DNA-binding GntR family transcriptional regulator